jgi:7-cyano-7-deazaguanine synthase in queuosine biosynthesis
VTYSHTVRKEVREVPRHPQRLHVDLNWEESALTARYRTSNGDAGAISVRYPFVLDDPASVGDAALGLAIAVYLGQLCLAETIELAFAVSAAMAADISPLAAMLYDIRRWKDELPSAPPPALFSLGSVVEPLAPRGAIDSRRTVLLWSGGKDSTLSALLLRANGYDPIAVHITANAGVENEEADAVLELGRDLGLKSCRVEYEHPEFLEFSSRYARHWNRRPLCNTVPFGRDLLLAVLAAPVAMEQGAAALSFGHDNECRNAFVEFGERTVPRNDVESTLGALAMEHYLGRYVTQGLRLLPPVAGLSELGILRAMLLEYPELMRRAAFCFWGGNCGQCAKCLRYYLAQRLFGADVLTFRTNPLGPDGAPELDDVLRLDASGVLFQVQILLCLGRLVERQDIRPEETRVRKFESTIYPTVAPRLDDWERDLLTIATDPQLPDGWRYN